MPYFAVRALLTAMVALLALATEVLADGSEKCLGFYGIPKDKVTGEFYSVDPCWGGAHITLAGFYAYPEKRSATEPEIPTWSQVLALPHQFGTHWAETCPEDSWHMASGVNSYWNQPVPAPTDPPYKQRFLDLGKEKSGEAVPSTTWTQVTDALARKGVQYKKPDESEDTAKPLHVTFDRCACREGLACNPVDVEEEWGKRNGTSTRYEWYMAAVEIPLAFCPRPEHSQPDACDADPHVTGEQRKCPSTDWFDVTVHDMTIVKTCPEPGRLLMTASALLALFLVRRNPRSSSP